MKRTYCRLLRPICVVIFISASLLLSFADNVINYSYDSSGNRISSLRAINLRGAELDSTGKAIPMLHDLNTRRITIYPNPTEGNFSVEIGQTETIEKSSISIYSMTGVTIYQVEDPDSVTEIDITTSPDGIYILRIMVNDEISTWRIIKQ